MLFCDGHLPSVVSESLVGVRHSVNVFPLLYGAAPVIGGVQQLRCELLPHGFFTSSAGAGNDPADREGGAPIVRDFDRHLVGGAADTPRLYFQDRLCLVERFLEDLDRIFLDALLDRVQGSVKDLLRGVLLAPVHHAVYEPGDQRAAVQGIGQRVSPWYFPAPRHTEMSPAASKGAYNAPLGTRGVE